MPYFGIYGLEFLEKRDIWNEQSRYWLILKFCKKAKMTKFWTKNLEFAYF